MVPMIEMVRLMKLCDCTICGTNVPSSAAPQFGFAMTAAMM